LFIGHEKISETLKQYESRICKTDKEYCLTGFVPLASATRPLVEHILYVVYSPAELSGAELIPYSNLLIFNPLKDDISSCLLPDLPVNYTELFTEETDSVQVKLRDFFDEALRSALMAETILDQLFHDGSVQEMVDSFTRGFNNPIFVFNAGYYLIAANYEMTKDQEGMEKIIHNGRLTEEEFKLLNNVQMPYKLIKKSEVPVRLHHPELGFDQLVCPIDYRKDMGHIVLCATNRPLKESDKRLLIMLRKGIYQQMVRQEFVRNNSGFPYEFLLKDLLDGKIIDEQGFEKRMNNVDLRFFKSIWCVVIEASRSQKTLDVLHLRNAFESLMPGTRTLIYNGELIVLFHMDDVIVLPEELKSRINAMCVADDLYAGLSNSFTDIKKLASYYRQALRAIELGTVRRDIPGLYCYDDYYMQHVICSFSQEPEADTFCSPKLMTLLEYDRKNGTELAYSLYMYLICERNSIAASNTMFIHRNTLVYRLKKIDALANIDYENFEERQYIILSYEMATGSRI
jgi:hypothetical protein